MAQSDDYETSLREQIEAALVTCERSRALLASGNNLAEAAREAVGRSRDLIARVKEALR